MGTTAADPRERRRVLQTGGKDLKPKSAPSKTDRSALPGFGNAAAAGSTAKKQQQAKSSKLNTPTKKNTTPPPAALAADAGARDILRNSAAAAATAAAANVAVDPYDFPADDCDEQQAGAATHMPANQQPQQPRPAAGSKFKTGSRLGALLGYGMRGGINNSSASRQLFSGVSGGAHAPFAGNSSAAAAGFASANTVVGTCMAGGQGRVKKQVDIRGFAEPMSLLSSPTRYSGKLPAGMLNHGNTCYLNAVLQALLSLPCLGRDLTGDSLAQLPLQPHGVTLALQTCLKQHTASCGAISPAAVSAAMAQLSSRWGGCRQEDAHEFLTALLEAVQTEVLAAQVRQVKSSTAPSSSDDSAPPSAAAAAAAAVVEAADSAMPDAHAEAEAEPQQLAGQQAAKAAEESVGLEAGAEQAGAAAAAPGGPYLRVSAALCPASRNFSGCLQHTLTCNECGHVTLVKEQFNHLSLDLPAAAGSHVGSAGAGSSSAPGSPVRGLGQQQQQQHGGDGELKWLLSGGVGQPTAGAAAADGTAHDALLVPDLQALLANFFAPESLEKACEACGAAAAQHSLTHAVRRLPRVLVVHLKRFQWQVLPGGGAICRKLSTRVRPDRQLHLGAVCCPGRPVPPLLAELMPAGLLQAADAACTADPGGGSSLAGSKRSRCDTDADAAAGDQGDAAVDADVEDAENVVKQDSGKHKQVKQQGLQQAWASAATHTAAAGGAGKHGQQQQQQQSRLGRMSQAEQQQQHGPGFSRKPLAVDSEQFGSVDDAFTTVLPGGGRFTDLTQLQQQQRPRKRSRSPPESAVIRASGELSIEAAEPDGADCFGLPRNNSSTHVVDLASMEDEDDDLQRAIKASLLTAAQEGHPTDITSCQQDAAQHGGNIGKPDAAGAAAAAADSLGAEAELDMPQWMNQGGAQGTAGECNTPPSTPKSQGRLGAPLRHNLDDNLHSWVNVSEQQQQQQQAGSGGLSGGAAGLFDGLAFSDERPAPPRSQQQQQDRYMPADTPFAGLPRIGLTGSNTFAPSSPARVEQPQPARGRNVSNSSGAGGPFSSHRSTAAAGAAAGGGSSGDAARPPVVNLLDGIDGMTEEQQLKRAMELSLLESAGGGAAGSSGGGGAAAGDLAGLVGKDGYDEDAALQKALEESAAAAEMQLLQQQAEAAAAQQQGTGENEGVGQQQQGAGSGSDTAAAAAVGSGDAEAAGDDDAVVVAEGGAGSDGGQQQQQQQRQRLPLVRLVEDSDCEDGDGKAASTAANSIEQAAPTAAADEEADLNPMQVDQPEQPTAAAAAADNKQQLGKENKDEQQQQLGAAGAAATRSKPKRRPLGEVLCSRDAARANSILGTSPAAAAPAAPLKQSNVAAAVAASAAAAAAAADVHGNGSGQAGELEAVHAAAAAQAAGAWPQQSAALYRLRAVVRHKGPLASSGHFVSEVLSDQQGGQWFHYDDSFVQPTKLETVVRRCEADGYLFFYINSAILGPTSKQQQQQQAQ